MLFDWFTLVAQGINFFVLVWLMKRFLYKPILHVIDEREKHIAMQLQEASAKKKEADKILDDFRRKNTEFDLQHQGLLNNALDEANRERQKLLEQARNEAEALRQKLRETLRTEQKGLSSEISNRTKTEVFAIARKILIDLASVNLEEQIADVFIKRIHGLEPQEKALFLSALTKSPGRVLVRSTFELPLGKQEAILREIKNTLGVGEDCTFEAAPSLVSGIELIASGHKIAWTIEDYLLSLEENIAELLKEKSEVPMENEPL